MKLTALWVKTDKNGEQYFSGPLGNAYISIRKNGFKKEDKHPDYIVYLDEAKKKEYNNSNEAKSDTPF